MTKTLLSLMAAATFGINCAWAEATVFVTPDDGNDARDLNAVLFDIHDAEEVTIDNSKKVTVTFEENVYDYELINLTTDDAENFSIMALPVDTDLTFTEPGSYVFEMEAGAIVIDGEPWGYFGTYYIYEAAPFSIVSWTPEGDNLAPADLENITLTFTTEVTRMNDYMMKALALYSLDEEGNLANEVASYTAVIDEADAKIARLTANNGVNITVAGVYSLQVPPTLFVSGDEKNLNTTINFTVTELAGITAIMGENAAYTVYTIGGVRVLENGTIGQVRSLAPGIYVINGRAAIIK